MTRVKVGARWIWLGLLAALLMPLLACRVSSPGTKLGEGPPTIGADTKRLPTFEPGALAGPGQGGVDLESTVSGPPKPPEPPPLPAPAVVEHGPVGEASAYQDVQIRFNRPMVPLGDKQRVSAAQAGFTITPKIPGEAYWAEPTRLVFEPEGELPPATEFEVHYKATLQAVDGPSLDVDERWSFGTRTPKLTLEPRWRDRLYGDTGYHWKARVLVHADQELSLRELRRRTRAEVRDGQGDAKELAIRVRELPRDRHGYREADFEIRPAKRWPAGEEVVIRVDGELVGEAGPRPMGYELAGSFEVAEGVEVVEVACVNGEYADGCELGPVRVRFSAPIRRSQTRHMRLQPSPRGTDFLAVWRQGTADDPRRDSYQAALVWGDLERGKPYTITIDERLVDVYGQPFVGEREFEFDFIEPPPALEIDAEGSFPLHEPAKIGVESRHLESVDLRVLLFEDEALAARVFEDRGEWPKRKGVKVINDHIQLRHAGNFAWSSKEIDLAKYTGGKPGMVAVEVAPSKLLTRAQGRTWPAGRRGLVQISDLGVTALGSISRGAVRVASLRDDRPIAGAEVELVSDAGEARAIGKTDRLGIVALPGSADFDEPLLRVRKGDDSLLVSIDGLSRSAVTTHETLRPGETARVALMTERTLYQPGERVRVMGWAAVASPYELSGLRRIPAKTRVALELIDHRDETVTTRTVRAKAHGKFWATLDIPAEAALGGYRVEARILGQTAQAGLRVKDFPIPDFEVSAEADRTDLHDGESTAISASARYYFGGGVPIKRLRTATECREADYRPPGLEPEWSVGPRHEWRYGRIGRGYPSVIRPLGAEAEQGNVGYEISPSAARKGFPTRCTHSLAVADATQREIGAEVGLWVHPPFYVAAKGPNILDHGDDARFDLRTLDFDGQPRAAPKLRVTLERRWSEAEYEGKGKKRRFIGYRQRDEKLPACTTDTEAGPARCDFAKLGYGSYTVTVEAEDRDYSAKMEDWLWVRRPNNAAFPSRPVERLSVEIGSPEPKVGDVIKARVRAPWARGRGLLAISKGGMHELRSFELRDGVADFDLEVEDAWVPGVYIHAVAIVPATFGGSGLPDVQYAHAKVELGNETRTLSVSVDAPELAQTGETIPIEVRAVDLQGKPAPGHVSVWAVDEAVLALSPLDIPAFAETFTVGFSAGVALRHGYNLLRLPFSARPDPYAPQAFDPNWMSNVGLIGKGGLGGSGSGYGSGSGAGFGARGSGGPNMPAARQNFSSAPIFIGDAELGSDGVARVEGTLPDNLTTFRLTAVVSSPIPKAEPEVEARFGVGDARTRVTRPLVVRAAMPRVMRPGDQAELGVIVDNLRGGAGELTVEVELHDAEGVLELVSKPTVTRSLAAGEQLRLPFVIRAHSSGEPKLEVRARLEPSAAGNRAVADAVKLPLPIEPERTLSDRVAVYGSLGEDGAALLPFVIPDHIDPNFGGLSVSIGTTLLGGLEDAVDYLVSYPYGCLEQTSSSLLPLIPLDSLVEQNFPLGIDDLDGYVRGGVERLRTMQLPSGGFAYWPGGQHEAPYASAYATWVLGQAKAAGHPVPGNMLGLADAYLDRLIAEWAVITGPSEGADIEAALILWTLAERSRARPAAITTLYERRARLPIFAKAMLTLAVAKQDPADERLGTLLTELRSSVDEREGFAKVETDRSYWTWYWDSEVRSSALVLLAFLQADPDHPLVAKLARGLLESRRGGRWANTQENAFALVALARYAAVYEAVEPDFEGRVWLGNEAVSRIAVEGRKFEFDEGFTPMTRLLEASGGPGGDEDLILERAGVGRMYYRVGLEWASTRTDLPAKAEGIAIARTLRDEDGALNMSEAVAAGTLLSLDVEIEVRADLDYVAIEVPLPAGLEAVDLELGKGGAAMKLSGSRGHWVSHQELHRDRVLIFADRLPPGSHTTTVPLRATTPGQYRMPAASAEMMYYPEVYGRTTSTQLSVR